MIGVVMDTKTEHGRHRFALKEGANGQLFLMLEPLDDGLPSFQSNQFILSLRADTSFAAAQQIEYLMNENIDGLSVMLAKQPTGAGS